MSLSHNGSPMAPQQACSGTRNGSQGASLDVRSTSLDAVLGGKPTVVDRSVYTMLQRLSPSLILTLSTVLRAALIVFGTFQDAYSDVRYTDIDYDVFTGASKLVHEGAEPRRAGSFRPAFVMALSVYHMI